MCEIYKSFGERVRYLRKENRMTQEVLAERVGLTVESISNIERGLNGLRFDHLERLSSALHKPIKELFDFAVIDRTPTVITPKSS